MNIGLIARADDGGLGALTWELWRHLCPTKTLIVHTAHQTRGSADITRYGMVDGPGGPTGDGSIRATRRDPRSSDVGWLLEGIDVLLTAETWYRRGLELEARAAGIRTVLYAMPEMHDPRDTADSIRVPTSWRMDLVPGADPEPLPFPVARDRLSPKLRSECQVLCHVASNAFYDRNGTALVMQAITRMTEPVHLIVRGPREAWPGGGRLGESTWEWREHHEGPYWEAWPDEADVLVQPRRFGGLSLVHQEALSLGMPCVVLDREPDRHWTPPDFIAPVDGWQGGIRVKGGTIDAEHTDPNALAPMLDVLVRCPELVAHASGAASIRAAELGWDVLLPTWCKALAG